MIPEFMKNDPNIVIIDDSIMVSDVKTLTPDQRIWLAGFMWCNGYRSIPLVAESSIRHPESLDGPLIKMFRED